MATSKILDLMDTVREDENRPEGLMEILENVQSQLGDDATDEDASELLVRCLAEQVEAIGDNYEMTEEDEKNMQEVTDIVRDYLDENQWKYAESKIRPDVICFELGFGMKQCHVRVKIYVETNPCVVRIDGIMPITMDPTYEYIVCKKILKFNYSKRFGSVEYDERDGELAYRYSFSTKHGLHKDDLDHAFHAVVISAVDCHEEIRKACAGRFSAGETREILVKINELVKDIQGEK